MVDAAGRRTRTYLRTPFEHDVFVSYAHVDNEPDRPDLEGKQGQLGWVDRFFQRFERALWRSLGTRADIWFDRYDLYDGHRFDAEIEHVVQKSGILLTLISPAYFETDYCRKELDWFVDEARTASGLDVGTRSRVQAVRVYDIPFQNWPDVVRGTNGSEFFRRDGDGLPLDPLHHDAQFSEALTRLANEVGSLLRAMRSQQVSSNGGSTSTASTAGENGVAAAPQAADGLRVFLAATSDTGRRVKRRLVSALEESRAASFHIAPPIPPPHQRALHPDALAAALDACDFSVHLLDGLPGEPIEAGAVSYPEEQCRAALQHRCDQLVVLPEFIDLTTIEEDGYRQFLAELEQGDKLLKKQGAHLRVIKGRGDELIDLILEFRQRRETALRPQAAAVRSVFIDVKTGDLTRIGELYDFLAEQRIDALTMASADPTPAENNSLFEQNLVHSGVFFVVFGDERDWVKARLERALKIILRDDLPVTPVVYAVPPPKKPAQLSFPFCEVVDSTAGFNAGAVRSLLNGATAP